MIPQVSSWRTVELSFESSIDVGNPYLEVDAEVVFTGPDGSEIRRPAFWDGGRTWKVRFAPTRPGIWTYGVSSTVELDRTNGSVECSDDLDDRAVYRHGFLRKGSGRYLAYADGRPFFWLGDTHWRFTSERWDEANKPGWTSQFRGMVDRRIEQGFTVYQTNLMMFDWSSGTSPYWVDGRLFEQLDVDYLQEIVDPRMGYIADRGLVNALGLGWSASVDIDLPGLKRFARYVVARYGAYPMVWTLGGEVAGYEPGLRQRRIEGWREVALAIQQADGYDHPRTAHATNERPIAPYFQDEDWLTLTLHQHGHGDFDLGTEHYGDYLAANAETPLVEGESLYEGLLSVEFAGRRPVTDTMVRQAAYRAIQSGCCGYTYGAQGCWNAAWDADDSRTMWGELPWYDGIDLPGAAQLSHLRRFYEGIGWERLRPFPTCFRSDYAVNNTVNPPQVAADPELATVVVYFGETYRPEGSATLMSLTSNPYTISWFDPRDGRFSLIAEHLRLINGRLAVPHKPDGRDWVLLAQTSDRDVRNA